MTRLIKYIIIALLVSTTGQKAMAQAARGFPRPYKHLPPPVVVRPAVPPGTRVIGNNRLFAIRKAYINQQLNLSPEEAAKFWPLYEQYQSELNSVLVDRHLNNMHAQNNLNQVDNDIYYEQRLLQIRKKYRDEFLHVLPVDKVAKLYQSEREFKDELIRHLREHSQ